MSDKYVLLLSKWELILFAVICLLVLAAVIVTVIISRKRVREINELSEDVDMIWDLWYRQLEREADARYKAYTTRGYADRLPEKTSAIPADKELQEKLLLADTKKQKKALLNEYLPDIMFPLVVCKMEGLDDLGKKEANQLRQLMRDYGVKPLKSNNSQSTPQKS